MSRAWLLTSGVLAGGSLVIFALPPVEDWALGPSPWGVLTAGWAHWNALHLGGNLIGVALVALLGHRAGLGTREAGAWLLAGPLGHALLLLHPQLPPYAGLSAWLHAGVAVAAVALVRQQRWRIGSAIGLGLLAKLLLEQPWGPLLRSNDWWGGATLPLAHSAGALAGALLGLSAGFVGRGAPAPAPSPHEH